MTSANERIQELQTEINDLRRQLTPVLNYKFSAMLRGTLSGKSQTIGLMSITGLSAGPGKRVAKLTRGVIPGDRRLADWFGHKGSKHITITISDLDDKITLAYAEPVGLEFSDLDAGANTVLMETLVVEYEELRY